MQYKSKHKALRGILVTLLVVLLLACSFGVGVKFGSPIERWFNDMFSIGNDVSSNVDFSELKYAALGDSITYAMDGTQGGARMNKPYCEIVKDTLGLKSVQNYGISGSTVCTKTNSETYSAYKPMCERYKQMSDDFDIVSVMGGTNDYFQFATLGTISDTDTETFYGALNVLAKGLKEKYPNAFTFFMSPIKVRNASANTSNTKRHDDICRAIKEVCAKYDISVLDTSTRVDFSQEYNADDYTGDGVHPSQAFHRYVLAPVIADFIRNNYKAA